MSRRVLLHLVAASALLAGCGRSSVRLDTRTFALRYLDVYQAVRIIGPYVDSTRPGAPGAMSAAIGVLSVRETPDNLDRIGRVLAQFDHPQPWVRLSFNLIQADGASRGDSAIREIESVLRPLFSFRGYALVGSTMVTGLEGSRTVQGIGGAGGPYRLQTMIAHVNGAGDSATVQLDVQLMYPGGEFSTTVGIPLRKTAVLGDVRSGPGTSALILTVRPELVAN